MTSGTAVGSESDSAKRQWYVHDAWNRLVEVWEDSNDDGYPDLAEGSGNDTLLRKPRDTILINPC
ncbi:MAG: hypothetical protein GY842_04215 [bacterium]|nr:hypothetical protein [bacterium]